MVRSPSLPSCGATRQRGTADKRGRLTALSRQAQACEERETLCEGRTAAEIATPGPEHIGQRRGHEEANQNPRGEEEKEHRTISLYRQPIFSND
jgi:hypothetical protein